MKYGFGVGIRTASIISYKTKCDLTEMVSISYSYDTYGGLSNVVSQLSAHEFGLIIRVGEKAETESEEEQATAE